MAQASVLKFEFEVLGNTLDDCRDKLDNLEQQILTQEGGEPWVTLVDEYKKAVLNQQALLKGDPTGAVYTGTRTVLFAGPTKIGQSVDSTYRDGFRPQSNTELE